MCGVARGVCGERGTDTDCVRDGAGTLGDGAWAFDGWLRRELRFGRGGGSCIPNSVSGGGLDSCGGMRLLMVSSTLKEGATGEGEGTGVPVVAARRGGRGNDGTVLSSDKDRSLR